MGEKKVVSRTVAIALGMICIILAVGLAGLFAYYVSIMNAQNNTISSLNSSIAIDNSKIANLTAIVNLKNGTVWANEESISQPAGNFTYTSWTHTTGYAGYVIVNVWSSSISNTKVELKYSAYGVEYDNIVNVGSHGLVSFPVLPANVVVRVINSNMSTGATETVTIIYYW